MNVHSISLSTYFCQERFIISQLDFISIHSATLFRNIFSLTKSHLKIFGERILFFHGFLPTGISIIYLLNENFLPLFILPNRKNYSLFLLLFFFLRTSFYLSQLTVNERRSWKYFPLSHPTWGESPSFPWGAARTLAISLTSSIPFEFELNLLWKPFLVRLGSAPSAGKKESYIIATVWKVCISGKTDIWKRTMIWLNQSSQMYL